MKVLTRLVATALLLCLLSCPAAAQTEEIQHPYLAERFSVEAGAFWPGINFTGRLDGSDPNEEIDFDESLNFKGSQATAYIDVRWRFGNKWSLWGQYWATEDSGQAILEEDVEWEDIIFKEGTNVGGGVALDIVRIFVGRKFDLAPHHEFGFGFGLHYMGLDTYLEGEVFVNDDTTDFQRFTAAANFPLPNIGAWYMYSWSPRWVFQARGAWLSANIGDYSGSLWDAQVGINYQAFKNIGFGLHYKGFMLDVDIDKNDWHGRADLNMRGPLLSVNATW